MLPILLLVTALIVYGSLYPWQFHAAVLPGNPLWILLQSWSFEINRYFVKDTAVNIVLYLPFGAFCYLWLSARAAWLKLAAPLFLAMLLSSCMEMVQLFDAKRVCSMLDVVTNVTGAGLGMAIASQFQTRVAIRPRKAAPLFLILCWVCAYLFPFMPDLSTHHLISKLAAFPTPLFSAAAFFSALVFWLAAARLMEAAYSRWWFLLLLPALPMRLFVSGITLAWTDLLPAVLACSIWIAWPTKGPGRDAILAGLLLAGILAAGLAPFHFSQLRQGFSWIPFRALFTTEWESGFAIFFRKCFSYGSAIWLLCAAGVSLVRSTAGVAIFLAAIEAIQLWLPNHVSESTDPLQAIMLGWMLYQLNRAPGTQTRPNASVRL